MHLRSPWPLALLVAILPACPEVGPIAADEADSYCEHGMAFEYVDNGSLSDLTEPKTSEVGRFSEIVLYVESEDAECDGGNYDETVELLFKMDEGSPWGATGQAFQFAGVRGGRFRVDGKYLRLRPRCDVPFSFEYTIAGARCADAP